ncbi:hypothetical protein PoB_002512700 [Plakobranchus ocellatus]|uniref:Uncharacterized protein n=1 Tax=Plakobranchus ocellatus TaxID=259542 RepID=A0AAV3ZVB6_9GAST|nr:hypothetical protein PoB_002512700 [Plakobranchus ocellatus]
MANIRIKESGLTEVFEKRITADNRRNRVVGSNRTSLTAEAISDEVGTVPAKKLCKQSQTIGLIPATKGLRKHAKPKNNTNWEKKHPRKPQNKILQFIIGKPKTSAKD